LRLPRLELELCRESGIAAGDRERGRPASRRSVVSRVDRRGYFRGHDRGHLAPHIVEPDDTRALAAQLRDRRKRTAPVRIEQPALPQQRARGREALRLPGERLLAPRRIELAVESCERRAVGAEPEGFVGEIDGLDEI